MASSALPNLDARLSSPAVLIFISYGFVSLFQACRAFSRKRTTILPEPCVQACVACFGAANPASGGAWMLWTIFVILLVLWLVGFVSSYTLGGFIHLLLVAAVVVLILQLISGRRPVV